MRFERFYGKCFEIKTKRGYVYTAINILRGKKTVGK
jgi:hypothetical protein